VLQISVCECVKEGQRSSENAKAADASAELETLRAKVFVCQVFALLLFRQVLPGHYNQIYVCFA